MLNKLATSWAIFKQSVSVISGNKELLLFPILTSVLTAGILFFFLAPVALQPTGHPYASGAHWKAVAQSIVTPESLAQIQKSSRVAPGERPL